MGGNVMVWLVEYKRQGREPDLLGFRNTQQEANSLMEEMRIKFHNEGKCDTDGTWIVRLKEL
jgi:hypothetical protein